jgi:hypothetical protein
MDSGRRKVLNTSRVGSQNFPPQNSSHMLELADDVSQRHTTADEVKTSVAALDELSLHGQPTFSPSNAGRTRCRSSAAVPTSEKGCLNRVRLPQPCPVLRKPAILAELAQSVLNAYGYGLLTNWSAMCQVGKGHRADCRPESFGGRAVLTQNGSASGRRSPSTATQVAP